MSNEPPNIADISHVYSGNPLDRGDRERRDEVWISERARDPQSKFLPMWDLNVLISEGPQHSLGWLHLDDLGRLGVVDTGAIFLGLLDGVAHFAIDVSPNARAAQELGESGKWRFEDARSVTDLVNRAESGIVAQARSQVNWHNTHGFCSKCGHETLMRRGGQVRYCSSCDTEHFPRTDPVIIMVVSDNDYCLLGQSRGRLSRMNMYSALAGFMDQGESIEEAVAREVMEEAGIKVKNVRYHSSQPWPFPSSLMIGCLADAATTKISMDTEEMTSVRWFHREETILALQEKSDKLMVPGPIAIAHHLIKAWAIPDR